LSAPIELLDSNRVSAVDMRHQVESPIKLFLQRRPVHPLAWSLLGWCQQYRNQWSAASESYQHCLRSLNHILRHCPQALVTESIVSVSSTMLHFALHNLSLCHAMGALESGTKSPFSSVISSLDLREISRCVRDPSLSPDQLALMSESLFRYHEAAALQTAISRSSTADGIIKDILLCGRLAHSAASNPQSYRDILVSIGKKASKALVSAEPTTPEEAHCLTALRQSSEAAIAVLSALLMESKQGSEDHHLFESLRHSHPQNPRILLLMRSCASLTLAQSELRELSARSCVLTSKALTAAVDSEDFLSKKSFRCHTNKSASASASASASTDDQCHCLEALTSHGSRLVSAHSDSVAANSLDRIRSGVRSTATHRRDLLRAIFYDPSNPCTWSALVGTVYGDQVLGCGGEQQPLSCSESKGEDEGKVASTADALSGCFADEESLPICGRIAFYLDGTSPGLLDPRASSLLLHLTTPTTEGKDPFAHRLHSARKEVQAKHYDEAARWYRELVDELAAAVRPATTASILPLLLQSSYELAQVLSLHLSQPEQAEKLFQQCSNYRRDLDRASTSVAISGAPQIGYRTASALAYLHRYLRQRSAEDAQRAKEIIEECLQDVSLPPQVKAVCHAIHGSVWESQGKEKKASADYDLARAAFPEIEIPVSVQPCHGGPS
jgi:tetratricopeptide (TPR) repeat protein